MANIVSTPNTPQGLRPLETPRAGGGNASIDEFYLDLTGCEALYGEAAVMAAKIRQDVFDRTKLYCTVAIASNKYVAKIAGKTVKPDVPPLRHGSWDRVVREGQEEAFLAPLAIARLHGLGEKTQPRVKAMGVESIGDLRRFSKARLEQVFGPASAQWLFEACRGIDDSRW
jgi:DNA polymerase-4